MALQTDAVQQNCRQIARQVREFLRTLNLTFIVHNGGQHLESLSLAAQEMVSHPAAEQAMRILKTPRRNENSAFLGLVTWKENVFLGLASRMNIMALTTLNMDEFESLKDIRSQSWHMAWHALNLYQMRNDPALDDDFRNGLVIPEYTEADLASGNLRADVFSAVMSHMNGDKDAIVRLAHARSLDSLSCHPGHDPEHYPFPLAAEATQLALDELNKRPPSKKRQIPAAMKIADTIGQTYDDVSLKQWIYFCKPAQDMAWRGDDKTMIIGAAVSTSQDTYIRATGFLVSEILKIDPESIVSVQDNYSPFAEDRYNQKLHQTMIERAFQSAVNAGLSDKSGNAFSTVASQQNQRLTDGHILGWCAAALQAAGRAFDSALANGSKTPDQAARREFEVSREKTTWDSLKDLGETIVEQYRQGYAVTMSDIIDFCGNTPALAGISKSVGFTMKDPNYLKKLDIANDLAPSGPAPRNELRPKGPAPSSPNYSQGYAPPTLGLGSSENRVPPPTKPVDEKTDQ